VQFTAPDKERHIANRELGTIEHIDERGNAEIRLDSAARRGLSLADHPHLDYGYAVTSHSSQGATADRVLIHVDSEQVGEQLVNSRLAYVAVSRARYDAQIYTNDAANLGHELSREVSHAAAVEWDDHAGKSNAAASSEHGHEGSEHSSQAPAESHGQGQAMAME